MPGTYVGRIDAKVVWPHFNAMTEEQWDELFKQAERENMSTTEIGTGASVTEEIKPCPHCGGSHVRIDDDQPYGWRIICESCHLQIPYYGPSSNSLKRYNAMPRREEIHVKLLELVAGSVAGWICEGVIKKLAAKYKPEEAP